MIGMSGGEIIEKSRPIITSNIYRGKNLLVPELGVARLLEPEDLIKLTSPPQSPGTKIVEVGILFSF